MISQTTLDMAKDGTAWKTATMRGYWEKTVLDSEKYGKNAYSLAVVKSDGSKFTFYFNLDTSLPDAAAAEDSVGLEIDGELMRHLLTAQWQAGNATDYELVRGGTGEW